MTRFQHDAELHTAPLSLILVLSNMIIQFPKLGLVDNVEKENAVSHKSSLFVVCFVSSWANKLH